MDFFETINSSKAVEMMYANWYEQLPDERKAKMFSDLVQFGIETVRHNARQTNPFISEAEQMMLYFQANLKKELSQEMYAFVERKMIERSEKEWQKRFKTMKKHLNWSYEDIAIYMGAKNSASVKASLNRQLPAFAKLAVCVFEQMAQIHVAKLEPNL